MTQQATFTTAWRSSQPSMAYQSAGAKVIGMRQLRSALREVGVPKEAIKQAGKDSAELVANEARSLVPVKTGRLRDSIRLSAYASGRISILAGNNRKSRSGIPYANPIHWGWFKRNIKPQPFFVKALGYTRQEVFDNYFKQMQKLIRQEEQKSKIG